MRMRSIFSVFLGLVLAGVAWAQRPVPLVDYAKERGGWGFSNGQEFPGATGSLTLDREATDRGHPTLRLEGNFEKGGAYVNLGRRFEPTDVKRLVFRLKFPEHRELGLQINDSTGQTHQMRLALKDTAEWQEAVLPLEAFFEQRGKAGAVTGVSRYETWGGAKDGKWHGPATGLYIGIGPEEGRKTPTLWISEIVIEPPCDTFAATFAEASDNTWKTEGSVARDGSVSAATPGSLRLQRSVDDVQKPTAAAGPSFAVAPGTWELKAALKTSLASPDNSYRGVAELVLLDAEARELRRITVAEAFGETAWRPATVSVKFPRDAATARFEIRMLKAHGTLWVDDLGARRTAPPSPTERAAQRLLFSTAQLGNLLFPSDPRKVKIEVTAKRALQPAERRLTWTLRDFWGAEVAAPAEIALAEGSSAGSDWRHEAEIDLSSLPLEVGRYYELHGSLAAGPDEDPLEHFTSLAILPEAENRKHPPMEIPFTSRNWDNRLTEYMALSDRLGVRVCGLWGGWSLKEPYEPDLPGLAEVKKRGLGWLTNTPAAQVEANQKPLDETALREGARRFIEKFGANKPFVVNLGNEPHGSGEKVLRNVAAYKAVYEGLKAADPSVFVVATSVEPNEEYFRAGYGKYCDAFDFHIYESADDVRRTMRQYRALMKKYGVEKPLWSTELGLNSQGMSRRTVAAEVWRKTAGFFAEGGASMCWFTVMYPDRDGTSFGSSGDAHNMFDCRFNRYAPRLDAIAWFNAVNGIGVKRFVEEKRYPNGIQVFKFRAADGATLLMLWKDRGVADVVLPLPGVGKATLIGIDGRRTELNAARQDVTLTVDDDPRLLLFTGPDHPLAESLAPAKATLALTGSTNAEAPTVSLRGPIEFELNGTEPPTLPFGWSVAPAAGSGRWKAVPPPKTSAREGEISTLLPKARGVIYRRFVLTR